ncbi:hypothetical protein HMPREF9551_05629, partial [Escherichia coli MS 196-1]
MVIKRILSSKTTAIQRLWVIFYRLPGNRAFAPHHPQRHQRR